MNLLCALTLAFLIASLWFLWISNELMGIYAMMSAIFCMQVVTWLRTYSFKEEK